MKDVRGLCRKVCVLQKLAVVRRLVRRILEDIFHFDLYNKSGSEEKWFVFYFRNSLLLQTNKTRTLPKHRTWLAHSKDKSSQQLNSNPELLINCDVNHECLTSY